MLYSSPPVSSPIPAMPLPSMMTPQPCGMGVGFHTFGSWDRYQEYATPM
jgi:hypothetical protein